MFTLIARLIVAVNRAAWVAFIFRLALRRVFPVPLSTPVVWMQSDVRRRSLGHCLHGCVALQALQQTLTQTVGAIARCAGEK